MQCTHYAHMYVVITGIFTRQHPDVTIHKPPVPDSAAPRALFSVLCVCVCTTQHTRIVLFHAVALYIGQRGKRKRGRLRSRNPYAKVYTQSRCGVQLPAC